MAPTRRRRIERHLDEDDLDDALATADDPTFVRRLCFVKNLYRGDTLTEAAVRVGKSQPTASRWADRWNDEGLRGIEPRDRPGRPEKLDESARERVRSHVRSNPPISARELGRYIEAEFGVTYHQHYLYELKRRFADDESDP